MASPSGLWTAVSAGVAQNQNIEIIANNIANSKTVGYKKDEATFKEYLAANERPPSPVIDIPRTAFKDSDFYHHDGRDNAMVILDQVHTNHGQGHFRSTGATFDLAISGPGYFAVQGNGQVYFTRAGDFKLNSEGQLVNNEGYKLLGISPEAIEGIRAASQALQNEATNTGEQPSVEELQARAEAEAAFDQVNPFRQTAGRAIAQEGQQDQNENGPLQPITIPQSKNRIVITPNGRIYDGDQLVGSLITAEVANGTDLKKVSQGLFEYVNPSSAPRPSTTSSVAQGFLEESNVNTVSELVNLMKANRIYEGSMKAIKAYGDMAGKEANEVGKL